MVKVSISASFPTYLITALDYSKVKPSFIKFYNNSPSSPSDSPSTT